MPTTLENLVTAKEQIAAKLVEMTVSPKPTYSIDGQSVSWNEAFNTYTEMLSRLNALINAEGPYFIRSQVL